MENIYFLFLSVNSHFLCSLFLISLIVLSLFIYMYVIYTYNVVYVIYVIYTHICYIYGFFPGALYHVNEFRYTSLEIDLELLSILTSELLSFAI